MVRLEGRAPADAGEVWNWSTPAVRKRGGQFTFDSLLLREAKKKDFQNDFPLSEITGGDFQPKMT